VKEWDPMAVRLALLSHHYRQDWEWTDAEPGAAWQRLGRWRAVSGPGNGGDPVRQEVSAALADDLDTPGALEIIDRAAAAGHPVTGAAGLLGVVL